VAIDIAILPPPAVQQIAIELSASLPNDDWGRLILDDHDYLPHITLLQQFVNEADLDALFTRVGELARAQRRLALRVIGGGMGSSSVWMTVERTPALVDLHRRVLDALLPFDRKRGDASAFVDNDARDRDVAWVTGYRTASSGDAFQPHITLGHAARPPVIEPFDFEATLIAACHLGRFCSCRRVRCAWHVEPAPVPTPKP
jgi:2'-5' RNA ligase